MTQPVADFHGSDYGRSRRFLLGEPRAPRIGAIALGELFFLTVDGRQIQGVTIDTVPALTIGTARVLAEGNFLPSLGPERPYDVTPDGQAFVVIARQGGTGPGPALDMIFVQHWFEELTNLVPVD